MNLLYFSSLSLVYVAGQSSTLEHLKHLLVKETSDNWKISQFSYDVQDKLGNDKRKYLVNYIFELGNTYNLNPDTVFGAIFLMDQYISKPIILRYVQHNFANRDWYEDMIYATITIALKLHGAREEMVQFFEMIKYFGKKDQVAESESDIVAKQQGHLLTPDAYQFAATFLKLIQKRDLLHVDKIWTDDMTYTLVGVLKDLILQDNLKTEHPSFVGRVAVENVLDVINAKVSDEPWNLLIEEIGLPDATSHDAKRKLLNVDYSDPETLLESHNMLSLFLMIGIILFYAVFTPNNLK